MPDEADDLEELIREILQSQQHEGEELSITPLGDANAPPFYISTI